jgi:zinc/manganese transport system substrate-binding protein
VLRAWLCPVLALLAGGCGMGVSSAASGPAPGELPAVAAENFWGSIAAQLGGGKVAVRSIIVDPNTDPHSYDPTAADAVTLARAKLAIVNGIGYDRWAAQLLAADAGSSPVLLNVGELLGLREGDNPHQWYSPASVQRVVDRITGDYERLDPKDAAYFAARRSWFEKRGLARYHALITTIRRRFAGVPVGYSESLFRPLGQALGLDLLTPYSFAKAIAEGSEVSAEDKQTVDAQVRRHQIKVWVYNSQNATPDVQRVNELARAAHIPIATITETLAPAADSFEQWQVAQLTGLLQALHRATGR